MNRLKTKMHSNSRGRVKRHMKQKNTCWSLYITNEVVGADFLRALQLLG